MLTLNIDLYLSHHPQLTSVNLLPYFFPIPIAIAIQYCIVDLLVRLNFLSPVVPGFVPTLHMTHYYTSMSCFSSSFPSCNICLSITFSVEMLSLLSQSSCLGIHVYMCRKWFCRFSWTWNTSRTKGLLKLFVIISRHQWHFDMQVEDF